MDSNQWQQVNKKQGRVDEDDQWEIDWKVNRAIVVGFRRSTCWILYFFFNVLNAMVGTNQGDSNVWCSFFTNQLRNRRRSWSKLRRASRDMVRLLQSLVDLSSLEIINSSAIDLVNINTIVDDSPYWWKEDHISGWREGPVRPWQLCEDSTFQG